MKKQNEESTPCTSTTMRKLRFRRVVERRRELWKGIFEANVDLKKTFVSVPRETPFAFMCLCEISPSIIDLLTCLYARNVSVVKYGTNFSHPFPVNV